MKKLLYLPLIYQGGNEQWDLLKAFQKVYEVKTLDHLNLNEANGLLAGLVEGWQPDIVHCQFSDHIDPVVVKSLKEKYPAIVWTQWTGDCRPYPLPLIAEFGKIVDLTLLASGIGQKELYEKAGVKKVGYWQHAAPDWAFLPQLPHEERKGIVMLAHNYDPIDPSGDRKELVERLSQEFDDFIVYGSGWTDNVRHGDPIPWPKQSPIYQKAKISVGTNGVNTVTGYWSDRPYLAMASGTPHLTHYVSGWEEQFDIGVESFTYRSIDDAVTKLKWILQADPALIDEVGRVGQAKVRENHTFDKRVEEYQEMVAAL